MGSIQNISTLCGQNVVFLNADPGGHFADNQCGCKVLYIISTVQCVCTIIANKLRNATDLPCTVH
jgi:hypothetical protein